MNVRVEVRVLSPQLRFVRHYEQLREEVALLGWSGTGRKYGVSDNAIRKWMRAYDREGEAALNEDRPA